MYEKILVVDDEANIVDIIKFNLEKQNYRVVTAYDGYEAMDQFDKEKPDLVIHTGDIIFGEPAKESLTELLKTIGDKRIPWAVALGNHDGQFGMSRKEVYDYVRTLPYNINTAQLEEALSPKTKAVMLAHTLGNPFDIKTVKAFCDRHGLWLIEDNCDALGSRVGDSFTGTIGDIGTSSFYPPHHLTMGEGGAVYTNDALLSRIIRSMRDWGRDCVCPPGCDNFCGHRFDRQYGELPLGYDHKYVYSHFGYNLKATDMQAAVGCAQLDKFPEFVRARKANWKRLRDILDDTQDRLILPEALEGSDPSWFGFMITCRDGIDANKVVTEIEAKNVQTRRLFAGNLTKHPCFDQLRAKGTGYRVVSDLSVTDRIMKDTFWVGVYPGMTDAKIEYMGKVIKESVNGR